MQRVTGFVFVFCQYCNAELKPKRDVRPTLLKMMSEKTPLAFHKTEPRNVPQQEQQHIVQD